MSGLEKTLSQLIDEAKVNGSVTVKGVGTFSVKTIAAKQRRNPKTGAPVDAPGFKKLTFKMSKSFRETLGA